MEDFNRDNAKIEAAIQAEAAARTAAEAALRTLVAEKPAAEKLFSLTTSAQAQMVELDCSAINFADYFYITVFSQINGNGICRIHLNNPSYRSYSYFFGDSSSSAGFGYVRPGDHLGLLMTTRKQANFKTEGIMKAYNYMGTCRCESLTWGQVNKLVWKVDNADEYISAGSRAAIWGVK